MCKIYVVASYVAKPTNCQGPICPVKFSFYIILEPVLSLDFLKPLVLGFVHSGSETQQVSFSYFGNLKQA